MSDCEVENFIKLATKGEPNGLTLIYYRMSPDEHRRVNSIIWKLAIDELKKNLLNWCLGMGICIPHQALLHAARTSNMDMVVFLLGKFTVVSDSFHESLIYAAAAGGSVEILRLLEDHWLFNSQYINWQKAAEHSVSAGARYALDFCLEKNLEAVKHPASAGSVKAMDFSKLVIAAVKGEQEEMVHYLLTLDWRRTPSFLEEFLAVTALGDSEELLSTALFLFKKRRFSELHNALRALKVLSGTDGSSTNGGSTLLDQQLKREIKLLASLVSDIPTSELVKIVGLHWELHSVFMDVVNCDPTSEELVRALKVYIGTFKLELTGEESLELYNDHREVYDKYKKLHGTYTGVLQNPMFQTSM